MLLELRDIEAVIAVEIQISPDNRVWVNVDGQCVLRVRGTRDIEIADDRTKKQKSTARNRS